MFAAWITDLRHASRSLRRAPTFLATAVLQLALAICAVAGMFNVVYTVLLQPLPFPDPGRLVMLAGTAPGSDLPETFPLGYEFYFQYRDQSKLLDGIFVFSQGTSTFRTTNGVQRVERMPMAFTSRDMYATLGVTPQRGRLPTAEDGDRVVLISDRLWQTWFGADESVVGTSYFVSGMMRQVVGIMPPEFRFPTDATMVWVVDDTRVERVQPGNLGVSIAARMKPGATPEQLVVELTQISKGLPARFGGPAGYAKFVEQHRAIVAPLLDRLVGPTVSTSLWVLLGAVTVVLLIACANIANLFIVRAGGRQREMAVRHAIGASRAQLARLQMAEAFVVALAAGVIAVVLSGFTMPLFSTATSNAVIAGAAGLTKVGSGTLVLAAANSYSGETVIEGGTLELRGSASPAANCYVGYANSSAAMSITNGGTLSCPAGYLAVLAASAGNSATVTGSGSKWTTTTDLVVGYAGASNALTVSAAGETVTTNGFIGFGSAAANNAVLITGINSKWSNSNVLYVGYDAGGNTFTVKAGGYALSSKDTVIGFNTSSAANAVAVRGMGSKLEIPSSFTLIVGDNGDANQLEISAGGVVMGHNARLARSADSANNTVLVTGSGSKWTNTGTIRVGTLGPGNSVTVAAGGEVSFTGNAFIGHGIAAANNTVTVRDVGSKWTSGDLTVGLASLGNVLTVRDGASVTATGIAVATNPGSAGTVNAGEGGAPGALSGPIAFGAGTGIVNFNHTAPAYAFNDPISGPGAVRFLASGTTILGATSSYSGGTTLSAGTVRLGVTNALPSSGPVTFNGGTLDANDKSAALGELVLQASSTLRFGAGSVGQSIVFASAAAYGGGTLTIIGYQPGEDHLFITADPAASGLLDHIQFAGFPLGARWIPESGEVLPPPQRTAAAPALSVSGGIIAVVLLCGIAALMIGRSRRPTAPRQPRG